MFLLGQNFKICLTVAGPERLMLCDFANLDFLPKRHLKV